MKTSRCCNAIVLQEETLSNIEVAVCSNCQNLCEVVEIPWWKIAGFVVVWLLALFGVVSIALILSTWIGFGL